jgi:type III secretory pathway component EscT
MMLTALGSVAALLGPISLALMLMVLGLLSRRLGRATHARPYYFGFFVAGALVAAAALVRAASLIAPDEPADWTVLYNGLLALGITLGLLFTWYYWSWLLAERD